MRKETYQHLADAAGLVNEKLKDLRLEIVRLDSLGEENAARALRRERREMIFVYHALCAANNEK